MKTASNTGSLSWFLLLAGILCGAASVGRADDAATNVATRQITELIEKYTKSVNAADTRLAAEVWEDSDDVTFIHPRGHERGWKEIKENFYEKTMGAMFAQRRLAVRDVVIHVLGDFAWAEFYWDFEAALKDSGMPLTTKGRETQVYRRIDRGWVIVHVHYSGMPVTGQRQGF